MSFARPPVRRARFVTFGCKVNQYDTQVLRERARDAGFAEADDDSPADVVIVNTCTVTENAGAEARKAVRRMARENPDARIVVTGCYAGSDPEAAAALPGVTAVVENDRKGEIPRLLLDAGPGTCSAPPATPFPIRAIPFIEETISEFAGRTRAFVKIEDGCHLRCTFCIIPSVRPDVASKCPGTVVREVRDLVATGHREVVFTGVHLGAYGRDTNDWRGALAGLLRRVLDETDLPRLRLSSIEANEVTDELLDLYASSDRLSPHFHLPLQSGSRRVLRAMRRRYTPERFLATVGKIGDALDEPALTTDVIAGFPGESDAEFDETLDVVARAGFMKTHVFPYSPRRGTPAAAMPQVESAVVRERVARLTELGDRLASRYAERFLGRDVEVLVESRRLRGWLSGLTPRYVRLHLPGGDDLMNRLVRVRVTGVAPDGLHGEPV